MERDAVHSIYAFFVALDVCDIFPFHMKLGQWDAVELDKFAISFRASRCPRKELAA